mmetsp:Transcript_58355/g.173661  ORF Transcript_58355/g.173661 Transcript_58355/m.173661 type:complete len:243 (+) Transcript_58355:113-841(+)
MTRGRSITSSPLSLYPVTKQSAKSIVQVSDETIVMAARTPSTSTPQATINGVVTMSYSRMSITKNWKSIMGTECGLRPSFSSAHESPNASLILSLVEESTRDIWLGFCGLTLTLDLVMALITAPSSTSLMSTSSVRITMAPGHPGGRFDSLWSSASRFGVSLDSVALTSSDPSAKPPSSKKVVSDRDFSKNLFWARRVEAWSPSSRTWATVAANRAFGLSYSALLVSSSASHGGLQTAACGA